MPPGPMTVTPGGGRFRPVPRYCPLVTRIRMRRLHVGRFGDGGAAWRDVDVPRRRPGTVRVRVTHASVGATDVLAAAGGYLLHPLPGFATGYDIAGVVEEATGRAPGIRPGDRVAALLPGMGGHAEYVDVAPANLVPVPAGMDLATAALLPLDGITAALVAAHAEGAGVVFVAGASGPVGSLVAQRALAAGATVVGSASASNIAALEARGIRGVDHFAADWMQNARDAAGRDVDVAVDHRGDDRLRSLVSRRGVVVRTSFIGRPGHERGDTLRGSLSSAFRRAPRETVVSTPLTALFEPRRTSRLLARVVGDVSAGTLAPAEPEIVRPGDVLRDGRFVAHAGPGRKYVVAFE